MPPRDRRAYLWDIARAAEHIAAFTAGKGIGAGEYPLLHTREREAIEQVAEREQVSIRHQGW